MYYPPIPHLETSRLILRKIRSDDLEHYHHRLTSDPAVAKYMLWQPNSHISHTAETIARITAAYAAGGRYHWAIARKEDDTLIGTIALLRFDESDQSCSFAYMLGRDFWGQGLGTEALTAVFDFAFSQMGVGFISADHMAANPASGAVMHKAGMEKLRELPGQYEKDGTRLDAVLYGITREQWFRLK